MFRDPCMREARVCSSLEASKAKENEKILDKIIPMNEQVDPYATDGDDDVSYQPSPKKAKRPGIEKRGKQKTRKNNKRKILSKEDRVQRLKNKTLSGYLRQKSTTPITEPIQSAATKSVQSADLSVGNSQPNYDHFFTEVSTRSVLQHDMFNSSASASKTTSNTEQGNVSMDCMGGSRSASYSEQKNDSILESTDIRSKNSAVDLINSSSDRLKGLERNRETQQRSQNESTVDTSQVSNHTMMKLLEHVEKLTESVESLRRQVARVEAKGVLNQRSPRSSSESENEHALYDIDSSLASYGLPLRKYEDTNDFNSKLKEAAFRQKIVSNLKEKLIEFELNLIT